MNIIRDKKLFNTGINTCPYPTVYTGVAGDTTIVVPSGYVLEFMTFLNSTINNATISVGSTAGGTEVFQLLPVNGTGTNDGLTTYGLNYDRGIISDTTLYVHDGGGGNWNGATVTIYLVLRKII